MINISFLHLDTVKLRIIIILLAQNNSPDCRYNKKIKLPSPDFILKNQKNFVL